MKVNERRRSDFFSNAATDAILRSTIQNALKDKEPPPEIRKEIERKFRWLIAFSTEPVRSEPSPYQGQAMERFFQFTSIPLEVYTFNFRLGLL